MILAAKTHSVSHRDSSTSLGMTASFLRRGRFRFVRILGTDRERNSAPRGKLRGHDRFARRTCFHKIVQNAVRDRFIKRALVPIRREIKLERLAFDAKTVRHVIDVDPGKIGLARDWANRSEIIRFEMNPIIAAARDLGKSRAAPRQATLEVSLRFVRELSIACTF